MPFTSPVGLFDRFNQVGAHVVQIEGGVRSDFGCCDQVRVLRAGSPTDFYICWWSPWPEEDPRAMHVAHIVGVAYETPTEALRLKDDNGMTWEFTLAAGDFAASVADYHRHQATDPARYAALERGAIESAEALLFPVMRGR